ncbi:hypothetical protein COHA_006072 [Chlorella ohadii]|uniref:Cilia- and flagella-associated protein 45 n=1 Tax=Chlorella ohadii TaxID=2649997 RepID=A0AAD5H4U9_9CHLO|nr:hypothetical protein COHA_006072 [Chlorella ohadii]
MSASPRARAGSAGSRRPQIVARNSYVDETLFGCSARSPKACGSPSSASGASPCRGSPAAAKAVSPLAAGKGGAVVLSKSHLDRMMQKSPVLTPEEQEAARREAQEQLERELAEAKAARAARDAAAAAAEACRTQPKTEMELLRERERHEVISKAQLALLEEKEEIRRMNQMILHSKCMAARDLQVAEKAATHVQAAEEERRVVEEMEARRKAALAELEERERQRALEQKKGALTILDQLAERERGRAASDEARRQEGEAMKRRIQALKEEEQRREEERKAAAAALMDEVARGNAELAERKRQQRVAEVEENRRIAEYIRQRDQREQELAEERERAAKAKELEVARLRAMQEKIIDNRAAIDEARAKRYQDEHEMAERRKMAEEVARHEAMQRELEASRVEQLAWKAAQRAEAEAAEAAEVQRIRAVKARQEEQEHEAEIARLEAQRRHQQRLLKQMDERREMKGRAREELVAEGRRIREQLDEERALLEAVKQLKLQELEAAGVPKKYRAQLETMVPMAPQRGGK